MLLACPARLSSAKVPWAAQGAGINTVQISAAGRVGPRILAHIETQARPRQANSRCKSRSLGLDTVFRGVYPEPVEGLQTYSAGARSP